MNKHKIKKFLAALVAGIVFSLGLSAAPAQAVTVVAPRPLPATVTKSVGGGAKCVFHFWQSGAGDAFRQKAKITCFYGKAKTQAYRVRIKCYSALTGLYSYHNGKWVRDGKASSATCRWHEAIHSARDQWK